MKRIISEDQNTINIEGIEYIATAFSDNNEKSRCSICAFRYEEFDVCENIACIAPERDDCTDVYFTKKS